MQSSIAVVQHNDNGMAALWRVLAGSKDRITSCHYLFTFTSHALVAIIGQWVVRVRKPDDAITRHGSPENTPPKSGLCYGRHLIKGKSTTHVFKVEIVEGGDSQRPRFDTTPLHRASLWAPTSNQEGFSAKSGRRHPLFPNT